ncbi:ATP-binding cassette domain-containing protein [Shewanella sp. 10N.286.52.B9]|uniref:ATP-binding cassette domain-containing protein n=1 Tax=Shewanella sp. 10N.286.52.B9 TaxID=1880837 RepID=UPI000C825076|nr:ATP-binding cassette domain-containing protein [Shewanella sp. 10N.286.52.B9]PMG40411.1 ABC transporter permease [Shewanella sp. 10N.286.52.B9]
MDTLIAFDELNERLEHFKHGEYQQRFEQTPLLNGIAYALIALEWEGTPSILSDVFIHHDNHLSAFKATLTRVGYECLSIDIKTKDQLHEVTCPAFISLKHQNYILLSYNDKTCFLYDYENDNIFEYVFDPSGEFVASICYISSYSRLFREPPPESQDKKNWIKYSFYRYNAEFKDLIKLSLGINLLGALQPFFIMSVYNFALSAGSISTLLWLSAGAVMVACFEYILKKQRMEILATSGKELSCYISYSVLSKLLWLPYAMTSSAGTSSQLARLKDIDQFRQLVTAESSLSYFDLPFIFIFIIAIVIMSGTAAITVISGILVMVGFCVYGRYIYSKSASQSSRANAMVSYQWNEILSNTSSIQGLPLISVLKSRFNSALIQRLSDSHQVSTTNSKVQSMGGSLIQIIGITSIVTAVSGVMEGTTDAGAMLAIIILVWKALTPIMGIYNSLAKIDTIKASTGQINALMSLDDDRNKMEKSSPLNQFQGQLKVTGLTHRYTGLSKGLTNLSFRVGKGQKVSVCAPSGVGKTTLMNLFGGIETRFQGQITLDNYNITQFNSFKYRNSICYIPFDFHLYQGSILANYRLYNGYVDEDHIDKMISFFHLEKYLPEGKSTLITSGLIKSLPDGILRKIKLMIGIGSCQQKFLIIDEPFVGSEKENSHYLTSLFSSYLKKCTVIYTSNEKAMVATSDLCLLLDEEGAQKFFGTPDKVLSAASKILY